MRNQERSGSRNMWQQQRKKVELRISEQSNYHYLNQNHKNDLSVYTYQ